MRQPDETSYAAAHPGLDIKPAGRGVLVMSGNAVEMTMKPGHRREFINRAFSIPELSGLELDAGRARLRFAEGAGSVPTLLRGLARAMRLENPAHFPMADLGMIEVLSADRPVEIWRAGNRLTFLRVKAVTPERHRFFHAGFRDASVRHSILSELMGVAYLNGQTGSGRDGGYVEVGFQAGRMSAESLLAIVESALLATIGSASRNAFKPFHFRRRLVDTNLALAVLSDFLFPPARVLSAATLWALNVRHVRPTMTSLRNAKVNLDVLYSTVAFLTLLSLSFIASAIMYWMFEFWPRRAKHLRDEEIGKFLARLKRCPRSVWVDREGTEMEVDISHLRLGDKVILREGDVAPGDGVALTGNALVAESWAAGPRRKQAGDRIHCSGRVVGGEARIRLESLGTGAATATVAEWHGEAMRAPVSDERVKRTATAAVLPALALGALALTRGGVSMAKGVVRPDYVTGPLLSRQLGWVASVMEAARNGILIRNDGALEKLAQCDCFVLSPDTAWHPGSRQPEEIAEALRGLGVEEILMPMGRMEGSRSPALRQKGIADWRPVDAGGLIKERQFLGRKVAFIGDCAAHGEAASVADVCVHVCYPPFREVPPGNIALIEPALEAVPALRRIATAYNDASRASFATALIPNLACVIGAMYFGLPILGVLALTNAGTLASYLRAGRDLRAAASGRSIIAAY